MRYAKPQYTSEAKCVHSLAAFVMRGDIELEIISCLNGPP
jgi:hypothetical protein